MATQLYIPKDKTQAGHVITQIVQKGKERRNPKAIRWWIAYWYMQGARNFDNINYQNGTLHVNYVDESGVLKFQYEDIVSKYQTQLGRLMGLNLAPAVTRQGISLDGLRKSSIAQVALDAAFPQDKVTKLRQDLLPPLLMYGTVGLGLWAEEADSIGIDVIMPWELLPIPSDVSSPTDVRGLCRRRYVPVDWVKGLMITPDGKNKVYNEVESQQVQANQIPAEVYMKFQGATSLAASGEGFYTSSNTGKDYPSGRGLPRKDKTMMDMTEFVEIWTATPDGYLAEYIVAAGMRNKKQLYRFDHSAEKLHMPVRTISDIQVGGFWGRSYVDLLIPINTEVEITLRRAFQNVQDFDAFGLLMEPTTAGVPTEIMRGRDGIKRARFEPDYAVPELKPYNLTPSNSGTLPWRLSQLGIDVMDKIANQPNELLSGDAPGRVDSSAGLGMLYETSGVPLHPTAKSIAVAVSGCYKAMLGLIRKTWKDDKIVDVSQLDDSLAGIKFDPATGEMTLAENAIPHPDQVVITINSELPRSPQQQKLELNEALDRQLITPIEYMVEVRKRGLDLPVGNEVAWQNYRRAMFENLVLFGDGKTPGQVIVSGSDMHTIHLMVLEPFRARPEYYLAEPVVREAFNKHYEAHMTGLGQLPEGMEQPEDEAALMLEEQPTQAGSVPEGY